jgi:hypothetical protein
MTTAMSQIHDNSDSAPGASAQREYARRQQARRQRVRARYGPVGSLVAALAGEPRNVDAWRQGAEGEAATARALEWRLHRSDAIVMHDRRVAWGGRANVDHIAIGPGGVTVIDTKSSRGRIQLATVGIINRREQLLVNGRDRTSQLDSLQRQMERVAGVLVQNDAGDVSVFGALCFPFMRREWLHYNRARDGLITVDDPAHIAKLVKRAGLLTVDLRPAVRDWPEAAAPAHATETSAPGRGDGRRSAGSRRAARPARHRSRRRP